MKQTFSYALCAVAAAIFLSGCSGMNALLKSGQPELIYSKALEYYDKGKWQRAITLFEGVEHYYQGTSREDTVSFYKAYCRFKNRDYDTRLGGTRRLPPQIRPQRLHRGCRRDVCPLPLLPLPGPDTRPDP